MDHSGHSGHAASLDGPPPRPDGGSFEGHLLPGLLFLIWGAYWLLSILRLHMVQQRVRGGAAAAPVSRPWYPFPAWQQVPLEPVMKVALPLLGVLVELSPLGHGEWRPWYKRDGSGHLEGNHINNFQHALMYGGVALSGVVDLVGHFGLLPPGTEQAFLGLAFLGETLLMGLHAKHNPLDQLLHVLLTSLMVGCAAVCWAEVACSRSLLLALARPLLVMLQGSWFIEIGRMLFLGSKAWDMRDHAAVMAAPVVFTLHIFGMAALFLLVYLAAQAVADWALGAPAARHGGSKAGHAAVHYSPLGSAGFLVGAELELADLEGAGGLQGDDVREGAGRVALAADRMNGTAMHSHRK